jgi:antitoxin component HigA of HigAB toxin-antitoxin module
MKVKKHVAEALPRSLTGLVRLMPPLSIHDDVQHSNTLEMIERLMQLPDLTVGQSDYLETLVELVEGYESRHHALGEQRISGIELLRHVLDEASLSSADLARLLKIHPSMGSKILNGERRLTWDHAKILGRKFRLEPSAFMD